MSDGHCPLENVIWHFLYQCHHLVSRHIFISRDSVPRTLARTKDDDKRDFEVGYQEICPVDSMKMLNYSELEILLTTLTREIERMSSTAKTLVTCSEKNVI